MAKKNESRNKSTWTSSISHTNMLIWEIGNFEDWWSSRRIVKLEYQEGDLTKMDNAFEIEITKNWKESYHSPTMNWFIDGVPHEFEIAVLKYDSYDKHDDDHNLMMAISIYYKGPSDSVLINLSFCIKGTDVDYENSLITKKLGRNCYSDCRIINNHSLMTNKNLFLADGRLTFQCFIEIIKFQHFAEIDQLETNIRSRRTWNRCLPEYLHLSHKESASDAQSDFQKLKEQLKSKLKEIETKLVKIETKIEVEVALKIEIEKLKIVK